MTLKDRIREDMKAAMKSGDRIRLETLRMILASLVEKEIEKRIASPGVTPEDEMAILMNSAKKRRESIEMFEKGGRQDLVEQERKELAIVNEYLPEMMSPEKIGKVVDEIVGQMGAVSTGDFGKVMGAAMKQLKGKADGKVVQEVVRKRLGG